MSIFSRIKKKVQETAQKVGTAISSTYKKADTKLGGYLPGGPKPSEVTTPREERKAAEPVTEKQKEFESKTTAGKIISKVGRDIRGEMLTTDPYGNPILDPVTGEQVTIQAGTLPITPVGGATQMLSAAAKINKLGTLDDFLHVGTLSKTGNVVNQFQANTKTAALTVKLFGKTFSAKTILAVGGTIAGAASSMFLGQWAQAEAPEPISIVMRDVLKEAENTGNWELYNEAAEARSEITDLNMWKKILMWTPASVVIGITNKIKGAITGGVVMDKLAEDKQIQQESRETDDEMWARVRQEQADQDKAAVDYYNEQRKLQLKWEREAEKAGRNEDAKFWANEREKQMKMEEEDRKAIADFWQAYRKELAKINADNRPSNLNFGLI